MIFALRRNLIAYREAVKQRPMAEANNSAFRFPHSRPARQHSRDHRRRHAWAASRRSGALGRICSPRKRPNRARPPLYPWTEVLETSDVITLHSPLLPETRDMIAMPEFRAMKRRPLLINTARGGLVSETDLVVALREGLISGAGFDVLTKEPPDEDQPLLELLEMPNFILTPHVAWASDEAMQALADQLIDNIDSFVRGEPRNVVT